MPKIVNADRRRAEIAAAAMRAIARRGLAAARISDIAREAGATIGLVNHYFANRDEAIVGALRHATQLMGERIRAVVGGEDPIGTLLREVLPLDPRRREMWRVWVAFWGAAAAEADSALKREQVTRYRAWTAAIERALRLAGVGAGRTRPAAAKIAVIIDGVGLQATLDARAWPARRQLKVVRDAIDSVLGRET
jgi:TetR/AcrR family transcriptional regulator, transcriptional repressor of bet genes